MKYLTLTASECIGASHARSNLPSEAVFFNCWICGELKPLIDFIVHRPCRISRYNRRCYKCRRLIGEDRKKAEEEATERRTKECLPKSKYQEYIRSDEWKKKKSLMKKRCSVCKSFRVTLHGHHLHYKRLGFEKPGDIKPLCPVCHAAVHLLTGKSDEYPLRIARQKLKVLLRSLPLDWASIRKSLPREYAFLLARHFGVCNHVFVKDLIAGAKMDRLGKFLAKPR